MDIITASSQPKTLGDWAYLALKKHSEKTLEYEIDVLKDRDPEALHQMRVGMRRLRTAVTGFAPAIALPSAVTEKNIGKIARNLGHLRDLDVLQVTLQQDYLPEILPQERPILEKALTKLAKQRRKALEQVQKTLKGKSYRKLKQALQAWLDDPIYTEFAPMPIQEVLPDLLLPCISQLFLQPGWLVGSSIEEAEQDLPQTLSLEAVQQQITARGEQLHDLRKQTKRVRYQMNLFSDLYSFNYQACEEDMKQLQAVLGDIQDSVVLTAFLDRVLNGKIETKAPYLTSLLVKNCYQAWREWQILQHRYLDAYTRVCFRQEILQPVPEASTNGKCSSYTPQIKAY